MMNEPTTPITVVLVDDHAVVRHGLRALLENHSNILVVGEADNGTEAIRVVEQTRPQVMVLDLMIPGLNGLEVLRQVNYKCPETRVLILSMHAQENYVLEAFKFNAAGYVLKDAQPFDIVEAVEAVAKGQRYVSPPLSQDAIEAYLKNSQNSTTDPYETLTTREREVLQLTAEGLTAAESGARLFISPRTVEIHRAKVMRKLSLRNQSQLIRYAIKKNLLPPLSPLDLDLPPGQKPPFHSKGS